MEHKFNARLAGQYGVAAALLLEHIWWEIKENEFHGRCRYGGKTWMRRSIKAFTAHMPYLSRDIVKGGIARLKKAGLLVQGEHNECPFDRTSWYAFTEYGRKVMEESEDG